MKPLSAFAPAALVLALASGLAGDALAQGLKRSNQSAPSLSTTRRAEPSPPPAPLARGTQQADFIVALVNSEPITNYEVAQRLASVVQQMTQQNAEMPPRGVLARQVLERLINDRAQLQVARETGVKIDDAALDQAEQNLARQNQMDVTQLRQRLGADGISAARFRDDLRRQLTLQRVREREVEGRVRVSDLEVDQFLVEEKRNIDTSKLDLNLAQILVVVPEGSNATQVAALEARARRALERAKAGEDFAALVQEYSDGGLRSVGGQMGLRPADRIPPLFVEATKDLETGALSAVLRSDAGFHVLKVIERQQGELPGMKVTQSHARHILLRTNAQFTEQVAREKLFEMRQQIQSGKADFAALAREHSQDGSAKQGGDLGWASPGQFVPEFEDTMNALAPGEIALPLVSRFGVHLVQLIERREAALSPAEQRQVARNILREKKMEEAYTNWAQEVRGRAYVELREPPE